MYLIRVVIAAYVNLFPLAEWEKAYTVDLITTYIQPFVAVLWSLLIPVTIINCRHNTTAYQEIDEQAAGTETLVDLGCLLVQRITSWTSNTARRLVSAD